MITWIKRERRSTPAWLQFKTCLRHFSSFSFWEQKRWFFRVLLDEPSWEVPQHLESAVGFRRKRFIVSCYESWPLESKVFFLWGTLVHIQVIYQAPDEGTCVAWRTLASGIPTELLKVFRWDHLARARHTDISRQIPTHQFKLKVNDLGDVNLPRWSASSSSMSLGQKEDTLVLRPWSSAGPDTPSTWGAGSADTSAEPDRVLTQPSHHGKRNSSPCSAYASGAGSPNVPDPGSRTRLIPILPLFCHDSQDDRKLYSPTDFQ
jgi:hypothetical protein